MRELARSKQRSECNKGWKSRFHINRAARLLGSLTIATALTLGAAGCKREVKEDTELVEAHPKERNKFMTMLWKHFNGSLKTETFYPTMDSDMLVHPFTVKDGISYSVIFNEVSPQNVLGILNGFMGAMNEYHLERATDATGKLRSAYYKAEYIGIEYEASGENAGVLNLRVQFKVVEWNAPKDKKKRKK